MQHTPTQGIDRRVGRDSAVTARSGLARKAEHRPQDPR
jgi:hypothetical protein